MRRQKAYLRWWCDETATGALLARSEPVPDDRIYYRIVPHC